MAILASFFVPVIQAQRTNDILFLDLDGQGMQDDLMFVQSDGTIIYQVHIGEGVFLPQERNEALAGENPYRLKSLFLEQKHHLLVGIRGQCIRFFLNELSEGGTLRDRGCIPGSEGDLRDFATTQGNEVVVMTTDSLYLLMYAGDGKFDKTFLTSIPLGANVENIVYGDFDGLDRNEVVISSKGGEFYQYEVHGNKGLIKHEFQEQRMTVGLAGGLLARNLSSSILFYRFPHRLSIGHIYQDGFRFLGDLGDCLPDQGPIPSSMFSVIDWDPIAGDFDLEHDVVAPCGNQLALYINEGSNNYRMQVLDPFAGIGLAIATTYIRIGGQEVPIVAYGNSEGTIRFFIDPPTATGSESEEIYDSDGMAPYPNPFIDSMMISAGMNSTIKIFDVLGRQIRGSLEPIDQKKHRWTPPNNISAGLYVVLVTTEEGLVSRYTVIYRK